MPLHSELLRCAQTALILFILIILAILLQTRELLRASWPLKHCETRCSIDIQGLTDLSGRRDCEGQALALRVRVAFFLVVRGPVPRVEVEGVACLLLSEAGFTSPSL